MGASLGKSELLTAQFASEPDLVEHVRQVAIELIQHEGILALRAVLVAFEPHFNALSVEDLLAMAALDSLLGHI